MNDFSTLVLLDGKDKTAQIARWDLEGDRLAIVFHNNATVYRYGRGRAVVYRNPVELDPQYCQVIKGGRAVSGAVRIQQFERHIRVIYKSGAFNTFDRAAVDLVTSSLHETSVNDRFRYFRVLSHVDTLLGKDGLPVLGKRFDQIDFVRDDSILTDYLRGRLSDTNQLPTQTLFYPFGFNESQKQAVDNALNHRLSIIEGPPGTGKTQTILNIAANIVMRGQSVAIVSSNNSATENVEEKLRKYGVDFIAAFLGNAQNKEQFILAQKPIPDTAPWRMEQAEIQDAAVKLKDAQRTLNEKLRQKNELSTCRQEWQALLLEQAHFEMYYAETNDDDIAFKSIRHLRSDALLALLIQCEWQQERGLESSFWRKIYNFLRFGIYNTAFYQNSLDRMIAVCQKKFYEARLRELRQQIDALEKALDAYDFDARMADYTTLSMRLFRQYLAEKYPFTARETYAEGDLWKRSEDFIRDYPVILSTTHSLRSSLSSQYVYDYVIIDEASQVNVTTGALAFSCAKRAVIVGDLKQLPNVVTGEMRQKTDAIFAQYTLPAAYRYADHSLLQSVAELFPDAPRILLREHYRCHPKIIGFCNQKYYGGQLIVLTEDRGERAPLAAYRSVPGNHARDHYNQRQIDMICEEIIPQQGLDVNAPAIGIVTPYRNQANALQKTFAGTGVKADTVDKFQGQERDVIILSTVDNDISDFADDDHRLNVAVSRAVKQLIVVVSGNPPTRMTGIGDLVHYIQYNNMEVIDSAVYSVFDLLYRQYAEVRRALLAKRARISEFESENLMYGVITDVLQQEAYRKFGVLPHVPLRMILRDLSKLQSDREAAFVMNAHTHVDFLIYDKLSHQPAMIVEVDGHRFHQPGTPQAERDALKDAICARYRIPLERFRTTGSGEKERMENAMRQLC